MTVRLLARCSLRALAVLAVGLAFAPAMSHAQSLPVTQFASFDSPTAPPTDQNGNPILPFTFTAATGSSSSGAGELSGSQAVQFNVNNPQYLTPGGPSPAGAAVVHLTAHTAGEAVYIGGGQYSETMSGSITVTLGSSSTVLLEATFSNGLMTVSQNGAGNVTGTSFDTGTVTFTQNPVYFQTGLMRDASFATTLTTDLTTPLTTTNGGTYTSIKGFSGQINASQPGTFSAALVPEPSTVLMSGLGLLAIPMLNRRRSRKVQMANVA